MAEYEAFGEDEAPSLDLAPCGICGRTFLPEVLSRHQTICNKNATKAKKSKVFDSSKQRAIEADQTSFQKKSSQFTTKQVKRSHNEITEKPKKSDWKRKHEEFMNTLRAARGVQNAIKTGAPLPPPPAPSINPDYVQCQYCERRFSKTAAERHITFCKEQQQRIVTTKGNETAKQKQMIRTQYKAPNMKSRNSVSASPTNSPKKYAPGSYSAPAQQKRQLPPSSPARIKAGQKTSDSATFQSTKQTGGTQRNSKVTNTARSNLTSRGHSSPDDYSPDSYSQDHETTHNKSSWNRKSYSVSSEEETFNPYETTTGVALRTGRTSQGYEDARNMARNSSTERQQPRGKHNQSASRRYGNNENLANGHRSSFNLFNGSSPGSSYSVPSPPAGRPPPPPGSGSGSNRIKDYTDHVSDNDYTRPRSVTRKGSGAVKFCHECGTKYPVAIAKFCCECGVRRIVIA